MRFLLWIHYTTGLAVLVVVGLTAFHPAYADLLAQTTRELGPFEQGTATALAAAGLLATLASLRRPRPSGTDDGVDAAPDEPPTPGARSRLALAAVGALALAAAGEEVSWGQRWLGFETPAFFLAHAHQPELNLHNLVSDVLFNAAVYITAYTLFVVWPVVARLPLPGKERLPLPWGWLERVAPPLEATLVFCAGATLHAYFDPLTIGDTVFCVLALVLAGVLVAHSPPAGRTERWAHLAVIVAAMGAFAALHRLWAFDNLQYEIRELFIAYALLAWAVHGTARPRRELFADEA